LETYQALLSLVAHTRFEPPLSLDGREIMLSDIAFTFGALEKDVTVTDHFLEPYLVRFKFPPHRATAVSCHDFIFDGYKIQIRSWHLEDNAEQVTMKTD
jgi:hypothetical protein